MKHPKSNFIYKQILGSKRMLRKNHLLVEEIQNETKKTLTKTLDYYELATHTQITINNICTFLDINDFTVPTQTYLNQENIHILGGSPSRYINREIKPDKKWESYYKKRPLAYLVGKLIQKL